MKRSNNSRIPIFASPRDVFLELVLSIHELEAVAAKMRKAWWPPP